MKGMPWATCQIMKAASVIEIGRPRTYLLRMEGQNPDSDRLMFNGECTCFRLLAFR